MRSLVLSSETEGECLQNFFPCSARRAQRQTISPALFSLYQEKAIEADDIADILLIGEQIAKDWLCPMGFSLGKGYPVLKETISNSARTHAGKVLLIDGSDNICF